MMLFAIALLLIVLSIAFGIRVLNKIYRIPIKKHKDLAHLSEIPCRTHTIALDARQSLQAWHFSATAPAPAIILIHGWGDNADRLYPLVKPLQQLGLSVLLIDARFHGDSKGLGTASIQQFSEDLKSAVDWLLCVTEVRDNKILLLGHSLGAAAALLTAATDPRIGGVISISSFAHSVIQIRRELRLARVPYWPLGWCLVWYKQWRQGFSFETVAPLHTVRDIRVPVLLVHAKDDGTVPWQDAERIYANRYDEQTQLLVLHKGKHCPIPVLSKTPENLLRFIKACL